MADRIDAKRILDIITAAHEKGGRKYPKITLAVGNQRVVMYRAGEKSKYPGSVQVTDGGEGRNVWYGAINRESGKFFESRACTAEVRDLVERFANDPAAVAAAYGLEVGACCFCNRTLTDERSTGIGYGPICASLYGLPWGDRPGLIAEYDEADEGGEAGLAEAERSEGEVEDAHIEADILRAEIEEIPNGEAEQFLTRREADKIELARLVPGTAALIAHLLTVANRLGCGEYSEADRAALKTALEILEGRS